MSLLIAIALAASVPPATENPRAAERGLVVCVEPRAARAGVEALRAGGNAIDAAVATALCLAVTHPEAGNLGGGGFIVARMAKTGECFTVDFRETAPKLAAPGMFLDASGNIDKEKAGHGWAVVGTPGSPMGLWTAHRRAGKLPWKDVVQPAVELAEKGFIVDAYLARGLARMEKPFVRYGEPAKLFLKPEGKAPAAGETLRQPDLARTLTLLRDLGPDGFYRGEVAAKLEAAMKASGGLVRAEDLAAYKAALRAPVRGTYRGCEVISMPPPSSGGVTMLLMLNILEGFDLKAAGPQTAASTHLLAEAMKRGFCERARHLGDPDFVSMPLDRLLSKDYAAKLRAGIRLDRAAKPEEIGPELAPPPEGANTTHLSAVDGEGNMVALTTTLEDSYGARVAAPGTGFLLNNEMHDFNLRPGWTDRQGNVGTPANQVAPGKRMLSSMTPTLVLKNGKPFLAIGSPGGRTIINTVLQTLVNVVDHGMTIQAAVDAGRIHQQWLPEAVRVEKRLPVSLDAELRKLGHVLPDRKSGGGANQGDCHSILIDPATGAFLPGVDRRLRGSAWGY
ncbi:MAG TPA: gamma-glutamyltransferase [Planctomycetia bacterium]|nr:gamma-glutamyltransferase [Planctomycetia bacterium]